MVREVPELMERTPQEARHRWLRLTGRLGSGGMNGEGGREGDRGDQRAPGSPALDAFYVQVGDVAQALLASSAQYTNAGSCCRHASKHKCSHHRETARTRSTERNSSAVSIIL